MTDASTPCEPPKVVRGVPVAYLNEQWLPPVKTALAHVGMGATPTEAFSSMSNDGSAPFVRQAAPFGARGGCYDAGLDVAARMAESRMRKEPSAVTDRDAGVGHRVVSCRSSSTRSAAAPASRLHLFARVWTCSSRSASARPRFTSSCGSELALPSPSPRPRS
jgi:hypothetical protein